MRIFAGLPLPAPQVKKLMEALDYLKKTYLGLKTVNPDGLHITLHFYGELSEQKASELTRVMSDKEFAWKKIETSFSNFGQFPQRGNPRVIFVDIGKGKESISAYFNQYRECVIKSGFEWTDDDRVFIPHITMARNQYVKLPHDYLRLIPFTLNDTFLIDRCVLYQSILKPSGAEYKALKTIMFE